MSALSGLLDPTSSDDTTTTSPTSSPTTSSPPTTSSAPPTTSTTPTSTPTTSTPTSTPTTSPTSTSTPSTSTTSPSTTAASSALTSVASTTSLASTTSVGTSDGQAFTTVIEYTTTIAAPGSAVTSSNTSHSSSNTNTGAIVGGVVGGVGGAIVLLGLLIWYIRRRRRNSEKYLFDGNFDPAMHASATAPQISLDPDDEHGAHAHGGGGADEMLEDDGMGGRLGTGVGGVVTPFQYVPAGEQQGQYQSYAPAASLSGHSHGGPASPEMGYASLGTGLGPAAYPSATLQQAPPQGQGYLTNPYASPSATATSSESGYAAAYHGVPPQNPQGMYPALGLAAGAGAGAGADRAGSVSSHGGQTQSHYSQSSGPRTGTASARAKELEAFGGRTAGGMAVTNPDAPQGSGSGSAHQRQVSATAGGLIVHQDGGRVEDHEAEEEQAEIPPTYDSIPHERRGA